MSDCGLRIADCGLRIADGRWRMADGGWRIWEVLKVKSAFKNGFSYHILHSRKSISL